MATKAAVTWCVKTPKELTCNHHWVEALSQLRGEVLYEKGRRPGFYDGRTFFDKDGLDPLCYHVWAWAKEALIGCVRAMPLKASAIHSVTAHALGEKRFTAVYQQLSEEHLNIAEASRWIVSPAHAMKGVGLELFVVLWAIIIQFDLLCIASVGELFNYCVNRLGAARVKNHEGPYFSKKYNDTLYLVQFDCRNPPLHLMERILEKKEMLNGLAKEAWTDCVAEGHMAN